MLNNARPAEGTHALDKQSSVHLTFAVARFNVDGLSFCSGGKDQDPSFMEQLLEVLTLYHQPMPCDQRKRSKMVADQQLHVE